MSLSVSSALFRSYFHIVSLAIMSDKHSYKLVLSQPEEHYIIESTNDRQTKPVIRPRSKVIEPVKSTEIPLQLPSTTTLRDRIRLDSSEDLPNQPSSPVAECPRCQKRDMKKAKQVQGESGSVRQIIQDTEDYFNIERPITPPPWLRPQAGSQHVYSGVDQSFEKHTGKSTYDPQSVGRVSKSARKGTATGERCQRRGSSDTTDTAIWDPPVSPIPQRNSTSERPSRKGKHMSIEAPLTPPLTPRVRNSWETFSIDLDADEPEPRPTVSQYLSVQSPPSTLTGSSKSFHQSNPTSPPPQGRPKSSYEHHSGPSPFTRQSSLKAPTRYNHTSIPSLDLAYPPPLARAHSPTLSFDSLDLEADLEPLPPDLSSDPDFCAAMPWLSNPIMPGVPVSRILRHEDDNYNDDNQDNVTIASSIDSAAPPPIPLGRFNPAERGPDEEVARFRTLQLGGVRRPKGAPNKYPNSERGMVRAAGKLQKHQQQSQPQPTQKPKPITPLTAALHPTIQLSAFAPTPPPALASRPSTSANAKKINDIFSTLKKRGSNIKKPTNSDTGYPASSSASGSGSASGSSKEDSVVSIAGRTYAVAGLARLPSWENRGVSSRVDVSDGSEGRVGGGNSAGRSSSRGKGDTMRRKDAKRGGGNGGSWFDRQGV